MSEALDTRIDNAERKCPYCFSDGWIVGNVRADGADEMAPCPACRIGYANEFGSTELEKRGCYAPWGPQGYWRGRPWAEFAQRQDTEPKDADPAAVLLLMQNLGNALGRNPLADEETGKQKVRALL